MKFTNVVLAALVISGLGAPSLRDALADEGTYQSFFAGMEGDWRGEGVVTELQPNETWMGHPYRGEMEVSGSRVSSREPSWTFDQEIRFLEGVTRYNTIDFTLRDEALYISSHSATEPAWVDASTASDLQWRSRRVDPSLHRTWDMTSRMTLNDDGTQLHGENRVWFNGKLISVETYDLKKRR